MYQIEAVLLNETGLHARPVSIFMTEALKYKSDIKVVKDGKVYNGKSIMGILSIGAECGQKILIQAEGEDEKEAVTALKALIDRKFGL